MDRRIGAVGNQVNGERPGALPLDPTKGLRP